MSTYRDLITASMRLLGVKAQGEVASGAEAADALFTLNELIDSWNAMGTILYTTSNIVYPMTTLSQTYSIGPTGDIVVSTRPSRLVGAWLRDTSNTPNTDTPLTILADTDYGDIVAKGIQSAIPFAIYLDRQYPDGNLYLYPVPSDSSKSLVLQFLTPLSATVQLDDEENLPPAFRQALRFNLAALIAPEYGIEAPATVTSVAMTSLQKIEISNFQPYIMDFDIASTGVYNIVTDNYNY